MNEAVRLAVIHTLRDATSECLELLQKGNVPVREAIRCMSAAYLEAAAINSLAGLHIEEDEDPRKTFLEKAAEIYDIYKKEIAN